MKRRLFLIAVGAAALGTSAACSTTFESSSPTRDSSPTVASATTAEVGRFAFPGPTLVHKTFAGMTIEGQIRNASDGPWTVTVSAILLDGSGKLSGTVDGIVSDVQPGQSRPFLFESDDPPVAIAAVSMKVKSAIPGRLIPKFQIDGVTLTRGDAGLVVVGQLTNPETVPHSMTLIASFWDGQGRLVGAAKSGLVAVGGSETRPFAVAITDDVSSYRTIRVDVDSLVT